MVGKVKRWIRFWLYIDVLENENLRLARAIQAQAARLKTLEGRPEKNEDHEARIVFLENNLTAKQSAAKIVPKAHKTTFRQFAEAASKATEQETTA